MKTFFYQLVFACVLLCGLHAGTADNKGAQFPGNAALPSPNGKYELYCVDAQKPDDTANLGDNHALFLKEIGTGTTRKVTAFGRHVAVMWTPSGEAFFVNDHYGSNQVKCHVFACSSGQTREMPHRFSAVDSEGVAWVSGGLLKLIVRDPSGEREETVSVALK